MEPLQIGAERCFVATKKDGIPRLYFRRTMVRAASEARGTWWALITSMPILRKLWVSCNV